jgi:small subunit ribosomal protein S9
MADENEITPEGEAAVDTETVAEETAKPKPKAKAPDVAEPFAAKEKPKIKTIPVPEGVQFRATGRRKEAVARIIMTRGDGTMIINNTPAEKYMFRGTNMLVIRQPLELTSTTSLFNIKVNVKGGGQTGQAGAVKHAIARALCTYNPELRVLLKKAGHLTRDDRVVERKKYGMAKARKRFQFSKR